MERFEKPRSIQEDAERKSITIEIDNDPRFPHQVTGDMVWHEGKKLILKKKLSASSETFVGGNRGNEYAHEGHQKWEAVEATPDDVLGKWRQNNRWMLSRERDMILDKSAADLGLHLDASGHLTGPGKVYMVGYKNSEHPDYDVYKLDEESGKPWVDHQISNFTEKTEFQDLEKAREYLAAEQEAKRLMEAIVEYRDEQGKLIYTDRLL